MCPQFKLSEKSKVRTQFSWSLDARSRAGYGHILPPAMWEQYAQEGSRPASLNLSTAALWTELVSAVGGGGHGVVVLGPARYLAAPRTSNPLMRGDTLLPGVATKNVSRLCQMSSEEKTCLQLRTSGLETTAEKSHDLPALKQPRSTATLGGLTPPIRESLQEIDFSIIAFLEQASVLHSFSLCRKQGIQHHLLQGRWCSPLSMWPWG